MEKPSSLHIELAQNTFAPVVLDIGNSDFEAAMALYLEFLELPGHIKEQTKYMLDPRRRNTDFGWDNKTREKGNLDNKDVYHHGTKTRQVVESRLLHPPTAMLNFIDAAEEIYFSAAHALKKSFYELDETASGLVGIHFPTTIDWNHHLRFIAYYPTSDESLAAGHFDQSTLTLAMAESHNGLRIGSRPEDLQMVRHHQGQGLLFVGKGWDKLKDQTGINSDLRPAWHDVIRTPEQGVDENIMRWAIVLFANPAELNTAPSINETHALLAKTKPTIYPRSNK